MARKRRPTATTGWTPVERLRRFTELATELRETRLVREEFQFHFELSLQRGLPISSTMSEPPADDLRALMTIFRKFTADESPTYIYLIMNDCYRHIKPGVLIDGRNSESLKLELAAARNDWNETMKTGVMQIIVDGEATTAKDALDILMNGGIFHDDHEKVHKLRKLQSLPIPIVSIHLLAHLPRLLNVIFYTDMFIRWAFDKNVFDFSGGT